MFCTHCTFEPHVWICILFYAQSTNLVLNAVTNEDISFCQLILCIGQLVYWNAEAEQWVSGIPF